MLSFTTALAGSAFIMVGFAPISQVLAEIYEVHLLVVNLCVMIFLIGFVPMNFVSIWLYKRFKTMHVVVASTLITVVFAWLRLLMFPTNSFVIALIMTIPIALA